MRALLLHNPSATACRPALTAVVARALSAELKLDVEATKRRDHATFLAAGAVHEGYEAVVVLGGDGTVNEALQGVARTDVKLAIIPGGSTNAWARTMGLPNDALDATLLVLRKLREREDRRVNLGTANGRYFGFTAGYGFDAEVVRLVERRHRLKRTVRQATFLWCGLLAYARGFDREAASITLSAPGTDPTTGLKSAVCCNCNPWTYLGRRPVQLCPDATLDAGLDVLGLTRLGLTGLLRLGQVALTSGNVGALRGVRVWHDRARYELVNRTPLPLEVDGDYVGEVARVELRAVPRAVTVVA